jgi:hypothetical protein
MMIKTINDEIKSNFVEPKKLFEDLNKMYLSKYLIELLRNHYTEKERKKLKKDKKNSATNLGDCKGDWPICLNNIIKNNYYHKSPSFYLYREESIMGNFKHDHFAKKRKHTNKEVIDRASVRTTMGQEFRSPGGPIEQSTVYEAEIKNSEKQLLIERTKHICKFEVDPETEKKERDKKRRQMLFKIDLLEQKKLAGGSVARNKRKNSEDKISRHFLTPDAPTNLRSAKKPMDDLDILLKRYDTKTDSFSHSSNQSLT